MAVTVKPANGLSALKKLGLDYTSLEWLASSSIDVQLTAEGFVFSWPEHEYVAFSPIIVKVNLQAQQDLAAGTLTQGVKNLIVAKCQSAILAITGNGPVEPLQTGDEEMHGKAGLSVLPPLTVGTPDEPEVEAPNYDKFMMAGPYEPWPEFMGSKTQAPLIKLRDATMMYQPVAGTSLGSRYFVVGAGQGLRFAARLQGYKLSIRAEGATLKNNANLLMASGLIVSPDQEHASIHMDVGGDVKLASKTLGAVLAGMGIPLETPVPDASKVKASC